MKKEEKKLKAKQMFQINKIFFPTKASSKKNKGIKIKNSLGVIDFNSENTFNTKNMFKLDKNFLIKDKIKEDKDIPKLKKNDKLKENTVNPLNFIPVKEMNNETAFSEIKNLNMNGNRFLLNKNEGGKSKNFNPVEKENPKSEKSLSDVEEFCKRPKKALSKINLIDDDDDLFKLSDNAEDSDYMDSSRKLNKIFEVPKKKSLFQLRNVETGEIEQPELYEFNKHKKSSFNKDNNDKKALVDIINPDIYDGDNQQFFFNKEDVSPEPKDNNRIVKKDKTYKNVLEHVSTKNKTNSIGISNFQNMFNEGNKNTIEENNLAKNYNIIGTPDGKVKNKQTCKTPVPLNLLSKPNETNKNILNISSINKTKRSPNRKNNLKREFNKSCELNVRDLMNNMVYDSERESDKEEDSFSRREEHNSSQNMISPESPKRFNFNDFKLIKNKISPNAFTKTYDILQSLPRQRSREQLIHHNEDNCSRRSSPEKLMNKEYFKSKDYFDFAEKSNQKYLLDVCDSFAEDVKADETIFETDYEILDHLGSGNFGTVYKCRNKFDNLIYAVKVLKNNVHNAVNEAQALASLNMMYESTHIVRYFNSWKEDKDVYIVMEMCNQNLDEFTRNKQHLPEKKLRKIIKHVCKALSKLHKDKVVHLDIKPENILIANNGKFKISDLGLLKVLKNESDAKTLTEGDSRYMAKELLNDYEYSDIIDGVVDLTKADIFSLGVTVFELMVKNKTNLPQNGDFWLQLRNNELSILDDVEEFSDELKTLVKMMMEKDPVKRPTAKEILNQHLLYSKYAKIKRLTERLEELKKSLSKE